MKGHIEHHFDFEGMAEELLLKLIFANDTHSAEIATNLNTRVHDLKILILHQHLPDSVMHASRVERLRLFAAGKELGGKGGEDAKPLKDFPFARSLTGATPVHVQALQKTGPAPTGVATETAAKPTQCFCIIT